MIANFVTRLSLCLVVLPVIAAVPLGAIAGQTTVTQPRSVQMTPQKTASLLEDLQLTKEQNQKIQALRSSRTRAINKVLTPAQRTKFEQARKSGTKVGPALKGLGLSPDQNKKVLEILGKSQQELRNVLTVAQKQKLDAAMKRQGAAATVE